MNKNQAKDNIRSCLNWRNYFKIEDAFVLFILGESVDEYKQILLELNTRIDTYCTAVDNAENVEEIMEILQNIDTSKPV